jgi:calcineurin-like phosphoesterase family protein
MIFLTSDHHFGHERIIELCNRPFSSVDEMNQVMIDNWNDVVYPTDIVIHLGDFIMGTFVENINIIDRLNGKIMLVPGNHDRVSSAYTHKSMSAYQRFMQMYLDHGLTILPEIESGLLAASVTLCHYPYQGDSHEDDRFVDMRPVDNGDWLLHGHVHNEWKVNGRMINVGVDVWDYTPVSLDEIEALVDSQPVM